MVTNNRSPVAEFTVRNYFEHCTT